MKWDGNENGIRTIYINEGQKQGIKRDGRKPMPISHGVMDS
jgi:hypothetical protein